MIPAPPREVITRLAAARAHEKAQALFYRALAVTAEEEGDAALAERLNGLLADEQHHLSRLTARLVELGQSVEALDSVKPPLCPLRGWESTARARERAEIERYTALLESQLDSRTRAMISEFLEAERRHETELGGKWMGA